MFYKLPRLLWPALLLAALATPLAARAQGGSHGLATPANRGVVSTLAGSGTAGSTDGPGAAASFNFPFGVAVDRGGTLYVADRASHLIRKISPAGEVSTLAGTAGRNGQADGPGPAASFDNPQGIAVDAAGTVYVADQQNCLIRKISPAGEVSTLAGSGKPGSANGIGTAASFSYPSGVAVDATGTVYVADYQNYLVRKISPAGEVSTLAGSGSRGSADGTGTAASFYYPASIAVDANGVVYVADNQNGLIRQITPAGVVSTLAGTAGQPGSTDGPGPAARFSGPRGLAVDAGGTVYVADYLNHLIRTISPAGVVSTLAGTVGSRGLDNGPGTAASFSHPSGVAVDAAGTVYVADYLNHLIRVIK